MDPWKIHHRVPVLAPGLQHGNLATTSAGAGHVIREGDDLRMVYWGKDDRDQNHLLAARASMAAPDRWTPAGGPLLSPQPQTLHNCTGPGFPFWLRVSESRVLLYFCGWGRPEGGKLPNTTGVAISDDGGVTFAYHDTHPVLPLDSPCDAEGTGSVWVLHDPETALFRMWYTAIARYFTRPEGVQTGHGDTIPHIGIAYAESEDGITWRKPLNGWVVTPRGFGVEPYEYICSKPCVVKTGSRFIMWVNTFGTAYRVHRLTSEDGLHWSWAPRVGPDGELGIGDPGSFDDVQRSYPSVLHADGILHAWFTGNGFGKTGMGYARQSAPQ